MNEDKMNQIRMVLTKDQIMTFVGGLHQIQLDYIDEAVARSDLRQAQEVLADIAKNAK
jgi:hypothetical protein